MQFPNRLFLITALASTLAVPAASAGDRFREQEQDWNFMRRPPGALVAAVREATAQYQDPARAAADGYVPVFGCVSGPDEGAMGVHYLRPDLLGDGAEDAAHPELLIYEPLQNGRLQLVGVEFFALADVWDGSHADGSPPLLMGHLFNFTNTPNRFRLPANYTLHVWAWSYNPKGTFSMWNPRVSCAAYTAA